MNNIRFILLSVAVVSSSVSVLAMIPTCRNGHNTPCKVADWNRGTYYGQCNRNCNANTNYWRQHPKCATQGCNNDCQSVLNAQGQYYAKCSKNCGNVGSNNRNNQNKKRILNNTNLPTCKTNGCQKTCSANSNGGYFDYCSKKCRDNGNQNKKQKSKNKNKNNTSLQLCKVCKVNQIDANFPGTQFCGNTCRLNNNQKIQNNNNNNNVSQALTTYLKAINQPLHNCVVFYNDKIWAVNYMFCNFYPCKIIVDGITYKNSEAAFQAGKIYQSNQKYLQELQNADGDRAFKIGKNGTWQGAQTTNVNRMREVLFAKFTQNQNLKQSLMSTGNKNLIEDTSTQNNAEFWGIGQNGTGKNVLGKLLEEVRWNLSQGVTDFANYKNTCYKF